MQGPLRRDVHTPHQAERGFRAALGPVSLHLQHTLVLQEEHEKGEAQLTTNLDLGVGQTSPHLFPGRSIVEKEDGRWFP